jgi:hypothetical protein
MENANYFNTHFESDIIIEDEELSLNLKNTLTKYKNLRKA